VTLKHSTLHTEHLELGARLVDFGGWRCPVVPRWDIAEHLACRNDAAVFDVSHLGTVRVEGPDSFELLQTSLTNDLNRIGPGRAQYQHLLDETDASVLDDIIVWWVAKERFDVCRTPQHREGDLGARWSRRDRRAGRHRRAGTTGARAPGDGLARGSRGRAFHGGRFRIQGCVVPRAVPAIPVRTASSARCPQRRPGLLARGGRSGGQTCRPRGPRHSAPRIGLPLHGHELGAGITPLQAGLGWVVSWTRVRSADARRWSGTCVGIRVACAPAGRRTKTT